MFTDFLKWNTGPPSERSERMLVVGAGEIHVDDTLGFFMQVYDTLLEFGVVDTLSGIFM